MLKQKRDAREVALLELFEAEEILAAMPYTPGVRALYERFNAAKTVLCGMVCSRIELTEAQYLGLAKRTRALKAEIAELWRAMATERS